MASASTNELEKTSATNENISNDSQASAAISDADADKLEDRIDDPDSAESEAMSTSTDSTESDPDLETLGTFELFIGHQFDPVDWLREALQLPCQKYVRGQGYTATLGHTWLAFIGKAVIEVFLALDNYQEGGYTNGKHEE